MTTEQAAQQPPQQAQPTPPLPPVVPAAGDGRNQMSIRYNTNPREQQHANWRIENSWMHARPFSVYVAAIGNHWKPQSWAHVMDMVQYTNEQGMYCVLDELQDRCFNPYDALGTMRNEGILRARQGFEYLCYVDNDVLPPKDALVRLVQRGCPIIAPYVEEPGSGRPLHGPVQKRYTGTQPVRWCVLSMLLFKTSVFNGFGTASFWSDAVGADEGFHFQKLWDAGHQAYIDTELIMPVQSNPTYPLTVAKMDNADEYWKARKQQLYSVPDRRPIDPNDPRVSPEGFYLPFLPVLCKPENGGCGKQQGGDWWRTSPVCPECQAKAAAPAQAPATNGHQPEAAIPAQEVAPVGAPAS